MTYQPERDGFSVARSNADTQDDRPVVVDDDGTTRTADDAHLVDDTRTDHVASERLETDRDAGRHTRATDAEDAHTVVAGDPRAVRGRRVDTVATTMMAPSAVVARERAAFGGIKWGSAFFGWLSAMGLAVILTGLVAGAGTALGIANDVNGSDVVGDVTRGNASTIGVAGAIAVLLIILVSYYAGGYVAGRMARFDGARQGLAVWLWSIVIAVIVGVVALVAGSQYDVLGNLNVFPRLPFGDSELSTAGVIALLATVVVSLLGAILGGLAGMGFHRKVDAVAFDPEPVTVSA
ncbi:hypothetical protein [Longivirga aurantiaca]|uniref:Major facilitator superfamily (MFS) profile domain-containing protein n=1 Tax=Longivirga aurantiaca TaxID=1837743 RepID=A0ABW1T0D7_9ACTN